MARFPIVDSDDDAWGTILNSFLAVSHNSDGTLQTIAFTQTAEGAAVPVFKAQPFTSGKASFEMVQSSSLFNGTYDQMVFLGFNPEVPCPGGTGVASQQSWHMAFENQYNNGTNTAVEWYLQYYSTTRAVSFRPMQFSVAMTSPTNYAAYGLIDLGNSAPAGWDSSFYFYGGTGGVQSTVMQLQANSTINTWGAFNMLPVGATSPLLQIAFGTGGSAGGGIVFSYNGVAQYHLKYIPGSPGLYFYDDVNAVYPLYIVAGAGQNGQVQCGSVFYPVQHATSGAPSWVEGGMYFDTTLNKLRVGGASGWETVTSS